MSDGAARHCTTTVDTPTPLDLLGHTLLCASSTDGISVVEEVGDVSQGAGELEVFDVLTELSEPALVLLFESVELCCEIDPCRP